MIAARRVFLCVVALAALAASLPAATASRALLQAQEQQVTPEAAQLQLAGAWRQSPVWQQWREQQQGQLAQLRASLREAAAGLLPVQSFDELINNRTSLVDSAVAAMRQASEAVTAASSGSRHLLQVPAPVNCSTLSGLEACAEPDCYNVFSLSRNATTAEVECVKLPEGGYTPPRGAAVIGAGRTSAGFTDIYAGDYLWDFYEENVLAGAAAQTTNTLAASALNQENLGSLSGEASIAADAQLVANALLGGAADGRAGVDFKAELASSQKPTTPLTGTFAVTGNAGVSGGASLNIPGTNTAGFLEAAQAKGGASNVVYDAQRYGRLVG